MKPTALNLGLSEASRCLEGVAQLASEVSACKHNPVDVTFREDGPSDTSLPDPWAKCSLSLGLCAPASVGSVTPQHA